MSRGQSHPVEIASQSVGPPAPLHILGGPVTRLHISAGQPARVHIGGEICRGGQQTADLGRQDRRHGPAN